MSDNLPANERPKTPPTPEMPPSPSGSPYSSPFHMGGLWGGVVLIIIGVVFLLQTMGLLSLGFNWWALFILIPGLGLLGRAYQASQEAGDVRGPLVGGLIVTMIAVIFLFNLNFGVMWPMFLIIAGLGILVAARR